MSMRGDAEMSNGEIARRLEDLHTQLSEGFRGTHGRLDKVNGQLDRHREAIGDHATALAEHRVKLSTLNAHLFGRPKADFPGSESLPITRRDLTIAAASIVAAVTALRWLPGLLEAIRLIP